MKFQLNKHLFKKWTWSTLCLMAILLTPSCSSDKPTYIEPHLSTMAATDISRTEATLHGIASVEGETNMPKLTFRYGTTESMEQQGQAVASDNSSGTTDGKTSQVFLHLDHLKAGTTYYYMLQGSNERTTTRSNTMSFTTQPNEKPTLGEVRIISHGPMSVIVGYEITDDGGEDIIETGCYFGKSNDDKQKIALTDGIQGTGQKKILIDNLDHISTYQIWPYAKSRVGETMGEAIPFTTSDAISLNEAGELSTLMGNNLYQYTSLTIAGPMNGDDLSCMRKMMGRNTDNTTTPGKLSTIDMTDVKIVAGGGSYGASRYTQDHVIGQGLFADCTQLTKVSLPSDATTLEKDAFEGCTSLAQIEIPAAITTILPSSGCPALESISVSGANANYKSIDGVLLDGKGTKVVWFPMGKKGSYTLPSTITAISNYAFKECSIETFILPDELTEIGQGAFMDSKVKEVKLPNNLKIVPPSIFQGCAQLSIVRLGSKTELISDYAFDRCLLTDIYITASYPPVCREHAFTTKETSFFNACKVHVPAGREAFYQSSKGWNQFKNIIAN